jgi:hypothetical protein
MKKKTAMTIFTSVKRPGSKSALLIFSLILLVALSTKAQPTQQGELSVTIDLYLEGLQKGDINLLNKAFAAEGQFCYLAEGQLACKKFSAVLPSWAARPDAKASGKILLSETKGNMGLVTYELNFAGKTFRDNLSLYRIDDRWQIVTKTTFVVAQ